MSAVEIPPRTREPKIDIDMTHLKELERVGSPGYVAPPEFPDAAVPVPMPAEADGSKPWSAEEKAAFVLGMHIFTRDFRSISRLVKTRSVHEIVLHYYASFKYTAGYFAWRSTAARWGLRAEHLVSGRRQTRLLALLAEALPTKTSDKLYDLAEEYNACDIQVEDFVLGLAALAGRDAVVSLVELDTAGPTMKDGRMVVDAATVEWFLSARATTVKDHFNDSIWPELEEAGWAADEAKAGGARGFHPPGRAAVALEGHRAVLMFLQKNPEMLPFKGEALHRKELEAMAGHRPRRAAAIGAPFSWRSQRRVVRSETSYLSARPAGSAPGSPGHRRSSLPCPKSRPAAPGGDSGKTCANCGTFSTPMWRKDKLTGAQVCNACGIYTKNHGRPRPVPNPPSRPAPSAEAEVVGHAGDEEDAGAGAAGAAAAAGAMAGAHKQAPNSPPTKPRSASRRGRGAAHSGSEEESGDETHPAAPPSGRHTPTCSEDASAGTMNPGTPEPVSPSPTKGDEAVSEGEVAGPPLADFMPAMQSMAYAAAQHMAGQPGMTDPAAMGHFMHQMVQQACAWYSMHQQHYGAGGEGMLHPPHHPPPGMVMMPPGCPPPTSPPAAPGPGAVRPVAVRPTPCQASHSAGSKRLLSTLDRLSSHEGEGAGADAGAGPAAKRPRAEAGEHANEDVDVGGNNNLHHVPKRVSIF